MLVNLAKRRFVKNNTGLSKEKTLFTSTTVLLCFFQFILWIRHENVTTLTCFWCREKRVFESMAWKSVLRERCHVFVLNVFSKTRNENSTHLCFMSVGNTRCAKKQANFWSMVLSKWRFCFAGDFPLFRIFHFSDAENFFWTVKTFFEPAWFKKSFHQLIN